MLKKYEYEEFLNMVKHDLENQEKSSLLPYQVREEDVFPEKVSPDPLDFHEIRALSGLTQQAFSEKYGIPKRSIENWEGGKRNPPAYVISLLERVVKEDIKK